MTIDQQVLAAWISAGAAVVQAIGAIAAILVAVKLASDSERRAIEAERSSAEREIAAERAAIERAEAADRAAAERIARSLRDQRTSMIDTIVTLARELLQNVDTEYAEAVEKFDTPTFGGTVSGGHSPRHAPALRELIPEWKIAARDASLVKALSRLDNAIQPWKTPAGGATGPSYVSTFRRFRDEIQSAIEEIESFGAPT